MCPLCCKTQPILKLLLYYRFSGTKLTRSSYFPMDPQDLSSQETVTFLQFLRV